MSPTSPRLSRRRFAQRFAILFIPCAVIACAVGYWLYQQQIQRRLNRLIQVQENQVALQCEAIEQGFGAVVSDLNLLSRSTGLLAAIQNPRPEHLAAVGEEFRKFAEVKQVYDQVRLLDVEGNEVVRVNMRNQRADLVPEHQLQAKAERYYFQIAADLRPGQIFFSVFDLNVENGRVETPWKPTVRLATPLFNEAGERRGILILNYLGQGMLRHFRRISDPAAGESMWLNQEGYWIYTEQAERAWGFMFPDRSQDRLDRLDPQAWGQMVASDSGSLATNYGLVTFRTVTPLASSDLPWGKTSQEVAFAEGKPYVWKVAAWLSRAQWQEQLADLRISAWGFGLAALTLISASCGGVAWYSLSRAAWAQSLQQSENRFQQMAQTVPEVFWLSGVERQRFFYVSPAFARIWGREVTLSETATAWSSAVLPADRELWQQTQQAMAQREPFSVRYRIRRSDGQIRWIWDQGFPVRENNRVTRYAGIAEDISDLQVAQQQLLQSERLAAMGEAITSLAHDSRNALQRSQVCLEMLAKRVQQQPEALDLAQRSQLALRELHQLYDRLKRFAAPLVLEPVPYSLQQLWHEVLADLKEDLQRHEIRIRSAPPLADDQCQFDPLALRQALRNILENSIDSLAAGLPSRAREIAIFWEELVWHDQPAVRILIQDNGSGIEEGAAEQIFAPFHTSKPQGTGLGLAITRRLIEAHDGQIEARNRIAKPGEPKPGEPGEGVHGLEIEIHLPRSLR